MTNTYSIRFMKPGEENEVCKLVSRVFNEFVAPDFSTEGIAEFRRYAQPSAMIQRCQKINQVLVAEKNNRIIGILELKGLDHISMLFVEIKGQGVGRALVERALQICREASPTVCQVTVHASRYATPIYRKLGFEITGGEQTKNGITFLPMSFRFKTV